MEWFYKTVPRLWTWALEILLPRSCASCYAPQETLCKNCREKIIIKSFQCFVCYARNYDGSFCRGACRAKAPKALKAVVWIGSYETDLRNAIRQYKYKKRKELAEPFGALLSKKLNMLCGKAPLQWIAVAIPLHPLKERKRTFNQSEYIARVISKELNIPTEERLLTRTKNTETQARTVTRQERYTNLDGAFLVDTRPQENLTVILVDDVATTGATLFEAARTLEKSGIKKIIGAVVAHG